MESTPTDESSAWERAKQESKRVYTTKWEFSVCTVLVGVILPVLVLGVVEHSHTSGEKMTVGAVAAAAAVCLLVVFIFQYCAAPVRQRNEARAALTAAVHALRMAQSQHREEETRLALHLAQVTDNAIEAQEFARRRQLKAALVQLTEDLALTEDLSRHAKTSDTTWNWSAFLPQYKGDAAIGARACEELASHSETENIYPTIKRVYRTLAELYGLAQGQAEGERARRQAMRAPADVDRPPSSDPAKGFDVFARLEGEVVTALKAVENARREWKLSG